MLNGVHNFTESHFSDVSKKNSVVAKMIEDNPDAVMRHLNGLKYTGVTFLLKVKTEPCPEHKALVVWAARHKRHEAINAILKIAQMAGKSISGILNYQDSKTGNTALHEAVLADSTSTVELLIEWCGEEASRVEFIQEKNKDGKSALDLAATDSGLKQYLSDIVHPSAGPLSPGPVEEPSVDAEHPNKILLPRLENYRLKDPRRDRPKIRAERTPQKIRSKALLSLKEQEAKKATKKLEELRKLEEEIDDFQSDQVVLQKFISCFDEIITCFNKPVDVNYKQVKKMQDLTGLKQRLNQLKNNNQDAYNKYLADIGTDVNDSKKAEKLKSVIEAKIEDINTHIQAVKDEITQLSTKKNIKNEEPLPSGKEAEKPDDLGKNELEQKLEHVKNKLEQLKAKLDSLKKVLINLKGALA